MVNLTDSNDEEQHDPEAAAREGWLGQRLQELRRLSRIPGVNLSEEAERLQGLLKSRRHERRRHDTWLTVQIARNKDRPRTREYIELLIDGLRGAARATGCGPTTAP